MTAPNLISSSFRFYKIFDSVTSVTFFEVIQNNKGQFIVILLLLRAKMDEIRKNLQEIVGRIEGLYSIMITDRDGVPLLKVIRH